MSQAERPLLFVGREDVFAFLRQQLTSGLSEGRQQATVLLGSPKMGKTAVLEALPAQIDSRYVTAHLDLAQVDYAHLGGLFAAMAEVTRLGFEASGISSYRLPPNPENDLADWWAWFNGEFMEVVLSALRNGRKLIYLFDQTDKLLNALEQGWLASETLEQLSALISRDDRLDIIFTLDSRQENRLSRYELFSEPLFFKRLGFLPDPAAVTLIDYLLPMGVEPVGQEAILAATGGHPFYLQVMGRALWERAGGDQRSDSTSVPSSDPSESSQSDSTLDAPPVTDAEITDDIPPITRPPIGLNDVIAITGETLAATQEVLKLAWEESSINERATLTALTALTTINRGEAITPETLRAWLVRESKSELDETAIASALRRLAYRDILRTPESGVYTFSNGLQHEWLRLKLESTPDTPPPAPVPPPPRRVLFPFILLLAGIVGAVVMFAILANLLPSGALNNVVTTSTLSLDLLATRQIIDATQTAIAMPTNTSTPLPTLTPSQTLTYTYTPSNTPSSTNTATSTATDTETITATPTATTTPTDAPTNSPTTTPTKSGATQSAVTATIASSSTTTGANPALVVATTAAPNTVTPSATATSTATNTATNTASATFTRTPTATLTPTNTRTFTVTPIPTNTRQPTIAPPNFPTAQFQAQSTVVIQ